MIAVYVRVSTVGQNEAGQRSAIQQWLSNHGHTDVEWYTDKQSGNTLDRPDFKRLQQDIFAGRVSTVVVWKLDRIGRNMRELINVFCDWMDRDLRLVSVTQCQDFRGTFGKGLAVQLAFFAEVEQELRKERQAAGIAEAKRRGIYIGRKKGSTKADPERARYLKQQGFTIREIRNALNASRSTVQRYLRLCPEPVDAEELAHSNSVKGKPKRRKHPPNKEASRNGSSYPS